MTRIPVTNVGHLPMQANKAIPDKLFFKIGEVCDLVEVEPHVLRYWEQEFSQLTPQKNRAGQRIYRRKDVEVAMRIKSLREEEGFTIAGAKKKLAAELRGGGKLKVVPMERPLEVAKPAEPVEPVELRVVAPVVESVSATSPSSPPSVSSGAAPPPLPLSDEARTTLRRVRRDLEALLTLLR